MYFIRVSSLLDPCFPFSSSSFLPHLFWFVSFLKQGLPVAPIREFAMETRLASVSIRSSCFCLWISGIKSMDHHTQLPSLLPSFLTFFILLSLSPSVLGSPPWGKFSSNQGLELLISLPPSSACWDYRDTTLCSHYYLFIHVWSTLLIFLPQYWLVFLPPAGPPFLYNRQNFF